MNSTKEPEYSQEVEEHQKKEKEQEKIITSVYLEL